MSSDYYFLKSNDISDIIIRQQLW